MASPFQAPPAGTPVPPNTSARYYTRQQVFSRVPISGSNWTSGKLASFVLEATGGRYFVPSESRIVMKLRAKSGSMANGTEAASFATSNKKLEKSVRFATDPVTNAFSAGMLSVNGTTVSQNAANLSDISRLQLRTEHTRAGAEAGGTAGLLSFNQKMTQEDFQSTFLDAAAGGSTAGKADSTDAQTRAALPLTYATPDERSDKHELLLNNFSGNAKNDDGSNANNATSAVEISSPLGQIFPVCRTEYFLPNCQVRIDLTISDSYRSDMFFSEVLKGQAGSAGVQISAANNGTATTQTVGAQTALTAAVDVAGYVPPVAAAARSPHLEIDEIFLDAMFAIPSAPLPPPTSMQIPFQDISVYTRSLAAGENFTEQFTSIPASIGLLAVALRSSTNSIGQNSELYELGGASGKGFKTFSMSLGALQLPQPAMQASMVNKQVGRAFADWLSVIGGSAMNGVGGEGASLTSWTKSPIIATRCLQDPGAYASTATLRFTLDSALTAADDAELVVWAVHSRVLEMFWDSGETFPSRVLVDDVLN